MAFATTCPQCRTSFKVVPDQLERGRGLVRCGVCKHVFAGADHLRYLDEPDSAQRAAAPASEPAAPSPATRRSQGEPSGAVAQAVPGPLPGGGAPLFPPPAEGEWDPLEAIGATAEGDGDRLIASRDNRRAANTAGAPGTAGPMVSSRDRTQEPVLGSGGDPMRDRARGAVREPTLGPAPASTRRPYPDPALDPAHDPAGDPRHDPANALGSPGTSRDEAHEGAGDDAHAIFTQAPSTWRSGVGANPFDRERSGPFGKSSSRFRLLGPLALVVLLALAAVQLALLFRSEIVNAVPALRPVVSLVAGAFGMKVEAPRSIAALSIDSTELQRAAGSGQAALHALLRNKDSRTVRWPALELTLTDQAGTVVLRKVILPAEYLPASAPQDGLRASSEWPIRLGLDPGSLAIANYSLTLFYP